MRCVSFITAISGFLAPAIAFPNSNEMQAGLSLQVASRATPDPCSLAEEPSVNASIQLASWLECQINGFYPFPENGDWPKVHAATFSKDLKFTFNDTHYDFDGSLELYHSINTTLGKNFAPFKHEFINTVAVPNSNGDKGGFVYLIGWVGGFHRLLQRDLYYTNAAFAVVKDVGGKREVVELRESSNIPNTAPLPETNEWECAFT